MAVSSSDRVHHSIGNVDGSVGPPATCCRWPRTLPERSFDLRVPRQHRVEARLALAFFGRQE